MDKMKRILEIAEETRAAANSTRVVSLCSHGGLLVIDISMIDFDVTQVIMFDAKPDDQISLAMLFLEYVEAISPSFSYASESEIFAAVGSAEVALQHGGLRDKIVFVRRVT